MPDAKPPRHLVGVWNPSYGTDVMESHIMLLRERAQRFRDGQEDEDNVYIWWGKIRSSRRQSALPHIADVLSLESELGDADGDANREMQLYLTDYRSLYVAHIGEITPDDPREDDDATHIPAIYLGKETHCDCWFQLWDIRRLVSDDTPAVIEELSKLRNTSYYDMPVSIYGGMIDLPLIVTRPDGARYFEADVRKQLTNDLFWVEFDSEHSGIGSTEKDLRENCFGEDLWAKLDPAARTFIATAEKLYRDHRSDGAFDFSPVILGFAKAFEVQTNILLKRALKGVRPLDRMVNIEGHTKDAGLAGPFMLGQLASIIGGDEGLNNRLKQHVSSDRDFFVASLPAILKQLADVRNAAAHSSALDRESVRKLRNQFLGVGCEGDLVKLARVKPI